MNPPVSVVFQRDYEPELVQMVLDDLNDRVGKLEDGTAYHLGDDTFSYIAEVEGRDILITDARWEKDVYVYSFSRLIH